MADPLSADEIVAALREEGCKVVEYRDWRSNNRNHKGAWGPVHGVMIHHTVTSGSHDTVELIYNGHSRLPGPLSLGCITKDGTIWLTGNGRTNHAGSGDDDVLRAVINEDPTPYPNERNTDGNARFYGFESENLGDGSDPWPAVQLDAIERASTALCRAHGWGERSVIGHLEWTNQKIDPRGFTMDSMRGRVARRLDGASIGDDDDMPKYVSLGMTEPFTLDPGEWVSIAWDTEWADHLGQHGENWRGFMSDVYYNGAVHIRLDGLAPGKECQIRVSEYHIGSNEHARDLPIKEVIGSAGDTFGAVPIVGTVGEGRRAYVRICHWDDKPVTVKRVEVQANVWPR